MTILAKKSFVTLHNVKYGFSVCEGNLHKYVAKRKLSLWRKASSFPLTDCISSGIMLIPSTCSHPIVCRVLPLRLGRVQLLHLRLKGKGEKSNKIVEIAKCNQKCKSFKSIFHSMFSMHTIGARGKSFFLYLISANRAEIVNLLR